jgi:hypothetical protein
MSLFFGTHVDRGQHRRGATHSSGVNLKPRRAAAVARSSRRVRNSTIHDPEIQPVDETAIAALLMRGRVYSHWDNVTMGVCAPPAGTVVATRPCVVEAPQATITRSQSVVQAQARVLPAC